MFEGWWWSFCQTERDRRPGVARATVSRTSALYIADQCWQLLAMAVTRRVRYDVPIHSLWGCESFAADICLYEHVSSKLAATCIQSSVNLHPTA